MTRRYDTVCFDLYGTLVDIRTDEYDKAAWEKLRAFLNDSGMGVHYVDQWFLRDLLEQSLIREQARAAERVRAAGISDCADEDLEPDRAEGFRSLFAVAAPQGRADAVWQAQADEMAPAPPGSSARPRSAISACTRARRSCCAGCAAPGSRRCW